MHICMYVCMSAHEVEFAPQRPSTPLVSTPLVSQELGDLQCSLGVQA